MRSLFDTAGRIAASQHGRITRTQLLAVGVTASRIARWLGDGRLRSVHRGVYAVGHLARSVRGDYMAAVLACGPSAVRSHRPAAQLLQLLTNTRPRVPEVTVATTAERRRPGIVVHRARALHAPDRSILDRIPITTVPRTLLDLSASLPAGDLSRACHEAWVHHRTTPAQVLACMQRNPARPGAPRLRLALGEDVTVSILEDGFVALLRAHRLPLPRTNIDHAGDKVDCHWPPIGLTVELLSYRFHGSRHAFEADVARRRRSNHLAFSYGDVLERGSQTVRELSALAGWTSCIE